MAITVKHTKVSTIPDGDDSSLIRPSDWNEDHTLVGLGTMAEQDANNVAITGGTISGVSGIGTVTSVAASAGTGISVSGSPITTSGTLTITNTAPDQVVSLTGAGTTSISGTYPNFTITSTGGSGGGDVVGPASATDNALVRFDSTTGKLIQNSLVIVDDTGSVTGVNALTAQSLTINNNATLGSSNTDTLEVLSRISTDLDPETNNAKDIGTSGRNWRDGFFGRTLHTVNLELTGTTSFDGSQGTSGQVLTSAGTGNTPTWTTPTTGTVTSVDATGGTGISVSGSPITSSGSLTITNTAPDQTVVLTAGTGISTSGTYPSFTVTNTAPDQTVAIASGTGISVSGTYPNFTVTNTAPSSGGTVTSVSGTAPIASSGGNTPAISISQATTSTDGYLSSTDWNTFNGKQPAGTYVTSVGATSPVTSTGGTTPTIAMPAATTSVSGYLTSTDWNTFNGKGSGTVTSVDLTAGTGISVSGGPITSSGSITVTNSAPMTYAGAGIAVSTGSAWGTSYTTSGSGTVVALATSPTLTTATTSGKFTFGGAIDETVYAVSGTTPALSPANGTIQTWTLSGNSTPTAGTFDAGESMTLMVDDGTAYTVTWTSVAVTWVGGTAPTLATTGYTVIELWKVGSTIYGALVGNVA